MKKASEYRQHAQECRALARTTQTDDHRVQLLKMAETWETLATERERLLTEKDRLAPDMALESRDPRLSMARETPA